MAKVTGLDGIVAADTDISLVDGTQGHLVYRGFWAKDLAVQYEYEEVAYLLCNGVLPDQAQNQQFTKNLTESRQLPEALKRLLDIIPREMPIMGVLQTAIAMLSGGIFIWPPTKEQAIRITAILPTIIAYRYRMQNGLSVIEPKPELGHTANFLYMLTGELPKPAHVKALGAYLILGMEHGMNASTFASRVVLSTQSDMASAISAAIGAMKGPLHGGAPTEVIAMLDAIGSKEHAEPWIRESLERGDRLMGFGHRIYKTKDPRAEALREVTEALSGNDPWFDLAVHVEKTAVRLLAEYKPGRHLYANVEFFAASIMRAIALPTELFTPTFTAARVVGWSAHLLEQAEVNRIFRPQSVYTGPMPG
ncbi:citrate synthase/methylcitrate synthase [Paenibacillus agricola]|uniref:Citrate synthase n=1 Tax=Paenibacillus agricola TaxID=2716264 RepID=A0ABX0JFS7_9BACL|nr:citrate synthase/methylcitrate synthase [Paenibacillus agricola]NHN33084.1 citrate synthase/methylcitrate synthase [Paenibacillus agricola]